MMMMMVPIASRLVGRVTDISAEQYMKAFAAMIMMTMIAMR